MIRFLNINFFLEVERKINISGFISYFKIFTAEAFEAGSNFKLNIYKEDKNKSLIYEYTKNSRINSFARNNFIFLKTYLYEIK